MIVGHVDNGENVDQKLAIKDLIYKDRAINKFNLS